MSRIGKQTINIPAGVSVEVKDGMIVVTGPKGTLNRTIHPAVQLTVADGVATVSVSNPLEKQERALWGTFSAHVKNMVQGVSTPFERKLEVHGVGYKVAMQGKDLKIDVGYSHSVIFPIPEGVTAQTEGNVITLQSINKELLGQTAAKVRAVRKPEPYKGKGIKYQEEIIRKKAGKTAAKA